MRDGAHSIECYMTCLANCIQRVEEAKGQPGYVLNCVDFFVNHCTSVYLCKRAFMKTVEVHESATGQKFGLKERAEMYETKGAPATRLTKRIGSTYTASVFVNLYSLLCSVPVEEMQGKRVSVFSYGSGSASTMYHLHARGPVQVDRSVFERLSTRQRITVEQFHSLAESYSATYGAKELIIQPLVPLEGVAKTYNRRSVLTSIDSYGVRNYETTTCR